MYEIIFVHTFFIRIIIKLRSRKLIKHLSKAFESLCDGLAIANLILMAGIGFFAGFFGGAALDFELAGCIGFGVGGVIIGLIIGYIVDVLTFGLYAQIIEIRKQLEKKE